MIFLYQGVGLEDIIREGLRVILVQSDQSVGLKDVRMRPLVALLHVAEVVS
jgi:hypothetical protein